ncbi:XFP N-terminal domain-containing protein [Diaporthe sp. PMI_573]|nr:XFP N-terminal domain-containing protein [Diaporthaceae sp. PMI_573]
MPHEQIDRPDPSPLPSHLPGFVLELQARPEIHHLPDDIRSSLQGFQHAACYIASAMIFLRDNVLLESPLELEHIKPRLLGHWGTCPGLVIVWSHLNLLLRNYEDSLRMMLTIGPGHGAPAALACLWLEGSLERFYPGLYDYNRKGLGNLISKFSVPGGHPRYVGFCQEMSFGAIMDNPDLVITCVVGDGEAETGPTAAAWHAIKYIDPSESGAVLPILHVNGFKISERTIFGCMDNKELVSLFSGYGYQVAVVEDIECIDDVLSSTLEWALGEICSIQKAARSKEPVVKPRWPMIVLRTPKGWTGPKKVDGQFIEGSFHSHQVPLPKANKDQGQLKLLEQWLSSYGISGLIQEDGRPSSKILNILPRKDAKKIGQVKDSDQKGSEDSCMKTAGELLKAVVQKNQRRIRVFSPDELESNKLDAVLDCTSRNFQWDEYSRAQGGRVIELLSEHCCQGFLQGYTLTGRIGIFPSYESFLGIVHTMVVQYSKFVKISAEVEWRSDVPSINYIETSTWTRQEHNGFSHQNPSFIGAVLNLKSAAARVYLPPDANCFLNTVHHCLKSRKYVNLIIGSKQPTPVYLSADEAAQHCKRGASIWKFASTHSGDDPDIVLVGIGVELTFEVVKAVELLRSLAPALKIRTVNVTDLMVLRKESDHPHAMSRQGFKDMFTEDRTVIFNYHGYPTEIQGLLFDRPRLNRIVINGYREEGSTTTPFHMMLLNGVSRYDVARTALRQATWRNEAVHEDLDKAIEDIDKRVEDIRKYIYDNGQDPEDTYQMPQVQII